MPATVNLIKPRGDNNIWVILDQETGKTAVIDPTSAAPVVTYYHRFRLSPPDLILITHHHHDHTEGAPLLRELFGAGIAGPAGEKDKLPDPDLLLTDQDRFLIGKTPVLVLHTPGHTDGHICYFLPDADPPLLFTGDTVFSLGCGRLFEGTAADMFTSFQKIAALPQETKLYPGHEYTKSNSLFARSFLPNNQALADFCTKLDRLSPQESTLPVILGEELLRNPFFLANSADEFAQIRAAKDKF